jgi:hypothetical protein
MKIGISPEQLLEIGLNMAGFLSAALMVMVIQSLFRRKNSSAGKVTTQSLEPKIPDHDSPPITREVSDSPKPEFVNLRGGRWHPREAAPVSDDKSGRSGSLSQKSNLSGRRYPVGHRSPVPRIARTERVIPNETVNLEPSRRKTK